MPAGQISGKLNLNAAGWSSAVDKAKREIKGLQDASKDAGHGTVSSMQAASASIRLLEGGMQGNIRAAERFISTIPGIGKALQAAFPLVGGIAFAGVFVKIGEEAAKAIQKVQQAPQVITNSFREMNLSAETAIDSLKLSTAKMQEQIDLLSGKRPNTLAEDLANASLAADKLATSLDNDNRKIAEMLKANGLSALSGFLGKAGTADVTGSVNYFDQQMSDLGARHQHAVRTGDTSGAADLQKQLDDKRIAALNYANSQLALRQQGQGPGSLNQDANVAGLTGFRNVLVDQQDQQTAEANDKATAAQLTKLEDAKKYAEMQKQAQAELLKVYEDQEKQQNAFNKLTINEEIQFWTDRISAFTKGGQSYLEVQNKIYDLIAKRPDLFTENKKNTAEVGKSAVEGNNTLDRGAEAFSKLNLEQVERATKAYEKYNEEAAKGEEITQKAASAFAEASIKIGLEQGTIDQLGAAQAMAAIHAQDHADALARINQELATQIDLINSDPKLSDTDRAGAIANAQKGADNKAAGVNGVYAVQQLSDAQKVRDQQLSPAMQDSLRVMMQDWSNMTGQIVQLMTRAIDSFNDDITKAIVGKGSAKDFGHSFSQLGEGLVKSGLQRGESALFGPLLGKGKGTVPGDSQNNRSYTSTVIEGFSPGGGAGMPNLGPFSNPSVVGPQGQGGAMPNLGPFIRPFFGGNQGQGNGPAAQSGGTQGGGGSIWGQLLHAFLPGLKLGGGGQGGGASAGTSDGMGDSGGGDVDFQGGFAGGGDVTANRPFLVGERGPEVLTLGSSGHVTPNSRIGGSSSTVHNWNIDARGSNDPAAIHAAVMRAAPHIIAASVQTQHSAAKRSPSGR